jgi:hypothetical protein
MATASNEAVIERLGNLRVRAGWLAGLAALAAAVIAVATFGYGSDPAAVPTTNYSARTASMLFSPDEVMVKRLASGGQIPLQTLNSRSFVIKGLINRGLVPQETLGDSILIRRLVNKGLIPEGSTE